jgi:hypothetical protein
MKTPLKIGLVLGLLTGLTLLYHRWNPVDASFFPECLFFRATGYHCPGCGSQRALHQLLHGELRQAAGHNLLLVLALPLLVGVGLIYFFDWLRKKQLDFSFLYSRTFLYCTLAVVLAFWLLRNLPFAPFLSLAP